MLLNGIYKYNYIIIIIIGRTGEQHLCYQNGYNFNGTVKLNKLQREEKYSLKKGFNFIDINLNNKNLELIFIDPSALDEKIYKKLKCKPCKDKSKCKSEGVMKTYPISIEGETLEEYIGKIDYVLFDTSTILFILGKNGLGHLKDSHKPALLKINAYLKSKGKVIFRRVINNSSFVLTNDQHKHILITPSDIQEVLTTKEYNYSDIFRHNYPLWHPSVPIKFPENILIVEKK